MHTAVTTMGLCHL